MYYDIIYTLREVDRHQSTERSKIYQTIIQFLRKIKSFVAKFKCNIKTEKKLNQCTN